MGYESNESGVEKKEKPNFELSNCAVEMEKHIREIYDGLPESLKEETEPKKIFQAYFEMKGPEFNHEVEKLAEQLDLSGRPEAIITIPVASYGDQEKESAKHISSVFENQTTKPLVIYFCNKPENQKWDTVPAILEKNGGKVIKMSLDADRVRAGGYRELMQAVVLMAALKQGGKYDPVQISCDVDTLEVQDTMVESHLKALKDPRIGASLGQLDWDNSKIKTESLPAFFIGAEMMRLLPKNGNWALINDAESVDEQTLRECIYSTRSFGRGVQANLSFRSSAYARVGGYDPKQKHDEFDYILRMIALDSDLKGITKLWDKVRVVCDSRRALWAYREGGLPPMRQWDLHAFLTTDLDKIRTKLPQISPNDLNFNPYAIQQQINETLVAFNLPLELLEPAVKKTLAQIGLAEGTYRITYRPYEPDNKLAIAEIVIDQSAGLKVYINQKRKEAELDPLA
ncbi:MAG: hypothetical protein GF347_02760 [Candidatus Moranbacteria bacterium]|nr:hypothetical protein [Candidatus Moranbacteria bacterium]